MTDAPVLEARQITRDYMTSGGFFGRAKAVRALKGISFSVAAGKTLAIVGESGCGKSTLARIITLIDPASGGELLLDGMPVDVARGAPSREMRRKVQIVFQNPYGSLNPRQKVGDILGEPLVINTDKPAEERRELAHATSDATTTSAASPRRSATARRPAPATASRWRCATTPPSPTP